MTRPPPLEDFLPRAGVEAWRSVAPVLPPGCYLAGGTGLAAHLAHRVSRDLDFFVDVSFDPSRLSRRMSGLGPQFTATLIEPGTLNGVLGETKLQFLDARRQHPVEDIELIHGMPVAGLGDLLATKLNAIGGRGALRDYFDLLVLDRDEGRRIEEGLILFVERYRPEVPSASVTHLVHSLGYMDDVEDDPGLPMSRADIEDYWDRRQPEVFRSLDRLGL